MITTSSTESECESHDFVNATSLEQCTSRLQSSQSSVSSDGDLSFSLAIDRELDALVLGDELPAFEIRLVSPLGRTPSPIDTNTEDFQTPTRIPICDDDSTPSAYCNSDFVTLQEINAKISPPVYEENSKTTLSRCNSLETIFEGVFLNTPPRKVSNASNMSSMRGDLFEKLVINRLKSGKENQIPGGCEAGSINSCSNDHLCGIPKGDRFRTNIN
ncbi:uncharacterized protein [Eurosta solidaginis]|uniref:uncharacterized protein n=1 Tax=Eurosta solidaginis TaxID=178769 RepID=UPI00353104D5